LLPPASKHINDRQQPVRVDCGFSGECLVPVPQELEQTSGRRSTRVDYFIMVSEVRCDQDSA